MHSRQQPSIARDGLADNLLAKMKADRILLSSVGCGQIFCGLCSTGFGLWSCWQATTEFRYSLGSNIWGGAEYVLCGCCCLLAAGSRRKNTVMFCVMVNLLSFLLAISLLVWSFIKALYRESFISTRTTIFHVGWLSVSSMSMLFFAAGLKFARNKYMHQFLGQDDASRPPNSDGGSYSRRVTTTFHEDYNWGVMNVHHQLPNIYSFTNESFIVPPPEEDAPPPYSEVPSLSHTRHIPGQSRRASRSEQFHQYITDAQNGSARNLASRSSSVAAGNRRSSTRHDRGDACASTRSASRLQPSDLPVNLTDDVSTVSSSRTVIVEPYMTGAINVDEMEAAVAEIDEAIADELHLNAAHHGRSSSIASDGTSVTVTVRVGADGTGANVIA